MTVAELIQNLSQVDPTLNVVISGYEGGYADVDTFECLTLKRDVNTDWYYGPHEWDEKGTVHLRLS